jgi:hypothetical protein
MGYQESLKKRMMLAKEGSYSISEPSLGMLEAQRRYAAALIKEYNAIAEYNNSMARFEWTKGATLRYNNVHISEGALPQAVQVRAVEYEKERTNSFLLLPRPDSLQQPGRHVAAKTSELPVIEAPSTMIETKFLQGPAMPPKTLLETLPDFEDKSVPAGKTLPLSKAGPGTPAMEPAPPLPKLEGSSASAPVPPPLPMLEGAAIPTNAPPPLPPLEAVNRSPKPAEAPPGFDGRWVSHRKKNADTPIDFKSSPALTQVLEIGEPSAIKLTSSTSQSAARFDSNVRHGPVESVPSGSALVPTGNTPPLDAILTRSLTPTPPAPGPLPATVPMDPQPLDFPGSQR